MSTELKETASTIGEAQNELYEIEKSAKSLYMLLDELLVREERGQLSADVAEDIGAVLQEKLLKASKRITGAREIIVCSMFTDEIPSIGSAKPSNDCPE